MDFLNFSDSKPLQGLGADVALAPPLGGVAVPILLVGVVVFLFYQREYGRKSRLEKIRKHKRIRHGLREERWDEEAFATMRKREAEPLPPGVTRWRR